jgi:hypothetical protein
MDCDSLRSPSEKDMKMDDALTSTRHATKMGIHDSEWWIRSSQRSPDRRSGDLASFRDPWRAGKIRETRSWGMLVLENMMSPNRESSQSCFMIDDLHRDWNCP